jgi:hypothetical protein
MQTKRERLLEALKTVGVVQPPPGFVEKFMFVLGCLACGGTWHPFDGDGIDVYEYDEETGEEVERLILTDEEKIKRKVWEMKGSLRSRFWLCPNGCNKGADIPADLHPEGLGLRFVTHCDATGNVLDDEEKAEFKAWAESLPDDESPENTEA